MSQADISNNMKIDNNRLHWSGSTCKSGWSTTLTCWRGTFIQDSTLDSPKCGHNAWTSSENHLQSRTSLVKLFFSYISFAISITLKANETKQEKHVHNTSQSKEYNCSKKILERKAPWDNVLGTFYSPKAMRWHKMTLLKQLAKHSEARGVMHEILFQWLIFC